MEHIARGAEVAVGRCHAQGVCGQGAETGGLIEQGDIDATRVGGMGDDVGIPQPGQAATLGELREHAVVFHLYQGHEVERCGAPGSKKRGGYLFQLVAQPQARPLLFALGREGQVVEAFGVEGVEEVLDVVLQNAEGNGLRPRGKHAQRKERKEKEEGEFTHDGMVRHAGWSWPYRVALQK